MSSLLKISAERDQMSAIERRIADFILDNSHLLRDYSSQQLADALRISQSSVVKFSQKLGFKGYPDLKFSVGEDYARRDPAEDGVAASLEVDDPQAALAEALWLAKTLAERETRLINPAATLAAIAGSLRGAGKVFVIGLGQDGVAARGFANRLSSLGIVTVHYFDTLLMAAAASAVAPGDVMLAFCEHGKQHALCQIGRQFRELRGKLVSVTRHTSNPLRAHADLALLISAHDDRQHIEPLLYLSSLTHLLDLLYVQLCEDGAGRLQELQASLERVRRVQET
jgi:DNA-binding MurR/RpiR family transcriptional regulator